MQFTYTIEARDIPGTLVRIIQVFTRRGCNISSLEVRPYRKDTWSIIDIAASDVDRPDQMAAGLEKLVDIHRVTVHRHRVLTKEYV